MKTRIKFSLITLVTAFVLFVAGIFMLPTPTTTASADSVTLSNFSIGGTNTQNHVQLVAGSGEMPADFVTFGQSNNNLAMIDTNGSTFGKTAMWREETKWWGIVGVLVANAKTFNIFPPSGQAVLGDHLMIPQGAVIATATDSVTFGEQVDLWYDGASWQMTEPVVLTDFTFGANNAAKYFDIVPTSGSIPSAIVSSGANLSTQGGTFGTSSTWTRDSGATTVKFPGQVGVLASAAQNFQIFPSGATAATGDVITIPAGATISVNGYCVAFGETITVTFNGIKWTGLPEYEAPSTPMTISALESNSSYDGTMYQIYVTVDVTATKTWGGWDNYATIMFNGSEQKADGWCFNSTHSLYVQYTTSEVANPLTLAKGTIVTIDNVRYKLANDFNIYHYDGALHTEPKPETTVISDFDFGDINRADRVDLVIKDNTLPDNFVAYGASNNLSSAEGTFGTTATWNTNKFKGMVGVLTNGNNGFMVFPSGATAVAGDVLTIPKGATIKANGCIVEFGVEVVLTFDGTKWSGVEEIVPATPMTLTRISTSRTIYDSGMYQIYLYTDITNSGATWGGWDNSTNVSLNGTDTRADWCFANTGANSLLYVQVTTAETANPITIKKGTQITINDTLYEIASDFNIYHYDGAFHTEAKVEIIPMTITGIDTTRTIYGSGMYQIYLYTNITNNGATWGGWDNSTNVSLNGTDTRADWCFANTGANSLLYVQVTTAETANPITIKAGTQITINDTLYEIASDFNIYHYNGAFHTVPKPETTPMTITAIASNSVYANGMYQIHLTTNITNSGATWGGWDNSAKLMFNGVETKADGWCFSNTGANSLLYVQVTTAETANPITIKAGTQVTINGILYEIANDFNIYHYGGAFHTEPKPATTPMTLGTLQGNSTYDGSQYALYISVDVEATTFWSGWDNNAKVLFNGVETKADGWCFSNVSVLYVQVSSTELATLMIEAGTLLTINDTLYEVANDFSVAYYAVEQTINGETSTVYANNVATNGTAVEMKYTLPEIPVNEGEIGLGWIYDGGLYPVGHELEGIESGLDIEAVLVEFSQLEGASVRIGTDTKGSGIRYTARLGGFNDYIDHMGIIVMPVDLMTKGELTHENYEVDTDCLEFMGDSSEVKLENHEDYGEAYYLKASVTGLFESNYTRTFTARAFLCIAYEDEDRYVYVEYNASQFERRICDVAKAALADEDEDFTDAQKTVLRSYAVDELITYAYFGPKSADDFANYANLNMDVVWLDMIAYRYHERYQTSWSLEQEEYMYNNPTDPSLDLKGAMAAAKAAGLKVIVYDEGIRRLSESTIPLIATDPSNPQLLGLWLQTAETTVVEILSGDANESYFDAENMTYTYSGSNFAGTNKAKVLKYVYQFADETALKNYIAAFMSQYAKESNFYGVMLADEPREDAYAQLALVKKIIAELYPDAYAQSCQLPSYHYNNFATFKTTLENYASKIAGNGDLGLDFYPFLDEKISIWDQIFGADTETENGVRINWLATMQYVAQTAAKYDLDFENTVQSHGMSEGYTAVTAAELALQVHLSLAFGADKISYFTYNQHDEGDLTMTQYINNDATLSAAVKAANKNGDYMKRVMTGFAYSKSKIFGASSNCLNTDNFTQSDLTTSIISSATNSVLVNEFYNEITGEYGYYIVNITIPDKNTSVTVNLTSTANVYQNSRIANLSSSITLGAGEGVFIVVA